DPGLGHIGVPVAITFAFEFVASLLPAIERPGNSDLFCMGRPHAKGDALRVRDGAHSGDVLRAAGGLLLTPVGVADDIRVLGHGLSRLSAACRGKPFTSVVVKLGDHPYRRFHAKMPINHYEYTRIGNITYQHFAEKGGTPKVSGSTGRSVEKGEGERRQ